MDAATKNYISQNTSDEETRILMVIAVYDKAGKMFTNMRTAVNDLMAKRTLQMEISKAPNGVIMRYPKDFAVYVIGAWDIVSGELIGSPEPKLMVEMSDLLNVNDKGDQI